MTTVIKSGNNGNTAEVTSDSELKVSSISEARSVAASIAGNGFVIVTPIIILTTASKSSLLWVSNVDIRQWVLSRASFSFAASTSGAGEIVVEILKNPTAGTLVDSGVATSAQNLDFGSPTLLSSDIKTGVEGQTLTNGTVLSQVLIPTDSSRTILAGESIILSPGTQIGLSVTPPTGNTFMKTHITLNLHRVFE